MLFLPYVFWQNIQFLKSKPGVPGVKLICLIAPEIKTLGLLGPTIFKYHVEKKLCTNTRERERFVITQNTNENQILFNEF